VTLVDRCLAAQVQRTIEHVAVRLVLWDGSSPYAGAVPSIGDLIVGDRGTLFGLLVNPELWFGEAYMARRLEIRGALEPVIEALCRASTPAPSATGWVRAALTIPNTMTSARRRSPYYDLEMTSISGGSTASSFYVRVFCKRSDVLEDAQRAKLDVCRKLRLQRGQSRRGWMRLGSSGAAHGAAHGARVKAFNVSREQLITLANAPGEGLTVASNSSTMIIGRKGEFDAFVSVGMLEHVGLHHLKPGGVLVEPCAAVVVGAFCISLDAMLRAR
jgi:cyclopropane-fatty-acyl-phospholipid synthase